jgi:RNase P/RNase MRP subunit p29
METLKIERKAREFEEINSPQKRLHLFSRFLINTDLKGKDHKRKALFRGKVIDFSDDCTNLTMEIHSATLFKEGLISLSKFIGRYVQIDGTIINILPNNKFVIQIDSLKLAKKSRTSTRIIPPPDVVHATNFHVIRAAVEMDSMNIPTVVKITFSDYENKLKKKFDHIKIDVYREKLDEKFYLVRSTGKTIYIRNTQDPSSYKPLDIEDYLDCEEEFFDDIPTVIKNYKNKKIVSEIIMPIIYVNNGTEAAPLGFVHIISNSKPIEMDDLMTAKMLTFEMIDRIRESHTIRHSQKVEILNISSEGLRVKITDPDLINQMPHIAGFSMDIVFKLQSPINVAVLIRNLMKDPTGVLILGLEIEGFRKGDKQRFLDNLYSLSRPSR